MYNGPIAERLASAVYCSRGPYVSLTTIELVFLLTLLILTTRLPSFGLPQQAPLLCTSTLKWEKSNGEIITTIWFFQRKHDCFLRRRPLIHASETHHAGTSSSIWTAEPGHTVPCSFAYRYHRYHRQIFCVEFFSQIHAGPLHPSRGN